jgi:hypothetical protein
VGGEILFTHAPEDLEMFWYRGEGVWSLRGGGSTKRATAAISWGYRCPWRVWGTYSPTTRYEIGARLIFGVTRVYDDSANWQMTFGLEVEPVGALRYLLGIRSWY